MPFYRLVMTEKGMPVYETYIRYNAVQEAETAARAWLQQHPKGSVLVLQEVEVLSIEFKYIATPPTEKK